MCEGSLLPCGCVQARESQRWGRETDFTRQHHLAQCSPPPPLPPAPSSPRSSQALSEGPISPKSSKHRSRAEHLAQALGLLTAGQSQAKRFRCKVFFTLSASGFLGLKASICWGGVDAYKFMGRLAFVWTCAGWFEGVCVCVYVCFHDCSFGLWARTCAVRNILRVTVRHNKSYRDVAYARGAI